MNVPESNTPLKPAYVDLHIHSTASDGSLSPIEIIKTAEEADLRAIAITDHDTVEGSVEAAEYERSSDLEILPGIEISTTAGPRIIHILGYMIDLGDPSIEKNLKVIQESRENRNLQIIEKLQALGFDVAYDEVLKVGGTGQMGRPHIAQVLIEKKIVQNVEEAFVKFLKKGKPAYVDRYRLPPQEAIQMILGAGGVPVLAHPYSLKVDNEGDLAGIIVDLKKMGLKGIEAYYAGHGPAQTALYEGLADRYGLLVTGGTDFHGAIKPWVHIGVGTGNLRVPYKVVEDLKRAAGVAASPRSNGVME